MTARTALRGAALGMSAALLAALVAEGWLVVHGEYLPGDPGYMVDVTVTPPGVAGKAIELVVLGDSTAAGVGSPTERQSLPALVSVRVADALRRPVRVVGYGASGARTNDVRRRQVPSLLDAEVDGVVIVVGSNDATHATPAWQMARRTMAMLRGASERSRAPIVLGGIPEFGTVPVLPWPLRWVLGRYAGVLRGRQRAAAHAFEGATFVDIAKLASPRFLGLPTSMSSDGFHPSPVGYGFWADALAPAVVDAVTASSS